MYTLKNFGRESSEGVTVTKNETITHQFREEEEEEESGTEKGGEKRNLASLFRHPVFFFFACSRNLKTLVLKDKVKQALWNIYDRRAHCFGEEVLVFLLQRFTKTECLSVSVLISSNGKTDH